MGYIQSRNQCDGQFLPCTERPASRFQGTNLATYEAPDLWISIALARKCLNQHTSRFLPGKLQLFHVNIIRLAFFTGFPNGKPRASPSQLGRSGGGNLMLIIYLISTEHHQAKWNNYITEVIAH